MIASFNPSVLQSRRPFDYSQVSFPGDEAAPVTSPKQSFAEGIVKSQDGFDKPKAVAASSKSAPAPAASTDKAVRKPSKHSHCIIS